jgi:steroid 5-alpha reductase family enzyme
MLDILPSDDHYLGITFVCVAALNLMAFAISYTLQFDKLTDFIGSFSFILCALLTFFANGAYTGRQIALTTLTLACRLELAGYLLYRVMKRGKDERFDTIRVNFWAFLGFWFGQIMWAWVVSLPVIFVNSDASDPPLGARDIAGIVIFSLAFLLEVFADFQKDAFRSDQANRGKVCDAGVWYFSRHPNFMGEIMMWWGMFILASPVLDASSSKWGYVTVLSPAITFITLMFGSGMPTAEGDNQKRFMKTAKQKAEFMAYRARTSPLIPLPPFVYSSLPLVVKRWLLFELPMYETDWSYVGDAQPGATAKAAEYQPPPATSVVTNPVDANNIRAAVAAV